MSRIDLNLLVVFEAVLRERSVTRAGLRLGLSQPAMSHALNRLRHMTGDQLFIRTPEGMVPTPRGERLAEPVRHALLELRSALETDAFIAEEATQHFSVAVNNYAAIALVGPILHRVRALAPHVHLRFRPSGTLDVADMLDRGELDLALVSRAPALSRFHVQKLIEDDFVGVVRSGHPCAAQPMNVQDFAGMQQLIISSSGDDLGRIDDVLVQAGLSRPVPFEVPYLSAGPVLTQSEMIAIMARHIGEEFRRAYAVQLVELPVQPAPLTALMVWQGRFQDQPAHQWFRQTIQSVAVDLAGPRPSA